VLLIFYQKVVPPLGNTTFSVVFLGREEGQTESMLFIHTSEGTVKFQVKGNSVSSPYRLRPLIGLQMPINASFSPLIHMHNPHPNPIQVNKPLCFKSRSLYFEQGSEKPEVLLKNLAGRFKKKLFFSL
jgi:hypothetical protein